MAKTLQNRVISRIYGHGRGWAFSQMDLADLGSRGAIDKILHQLAGQATIRRVMRGIYDYPRIGRLLEKQMPPNMHQVAQALERKFGWRIQPTGPTALNLIGLSTQVPSRYVYQSDGPNRKYMVGQTTLEFRHIASKEIGFRHGESGVIVQALRELGPESLDKRTLEKIRHWLAAERRGKVLKDTRRATGWVYAAIQKICREDERG